jgi:RHS repeat-associated protein
MLHVRRAMRVALLVVFVVGGSGTASAELQRRSWKVDASHGTFSEKIAITVPAFRGISPKLSLDYDSSGENGWLGVGWSLGGLSRIERASANKGAPKYDANDIYLLDGEQLVACVTGSASPSCTSGGTHSTKTESYSKITLTGSGPSSTWTVIAKDGTRSVYTAIYLVSSGTQVFKWGKSQVIDTKNNVVNYTWAVNQFGCCWEYPDSVTYNGTTIKLYWEARSDKDVGAVGSPGFTTVWGRIKTIDVMVNGSRVRAYKLAYTTSAGTSRSILTSVQQFGKDATLDASGTVTGGTSLPALTAGYQGGSPAFVSGATDTGMGNNSSTKHIAMDINGDGKTDMLELYPAFFGLNRQSWISNGTTFTSTSNDGGIGNNENTRFLAGDVNGDGKHDLVEVYPNTFNWARHIWVSNGTGFTSGPTVASAGGYNTNSRFLGMDINGDGKLDMVELYPNWGTYQRVTWLSNGTTFTNASSAGGISYRTDAQFYAMDVNGDGKSDLVELYPAGFGAAGRRIWLSTGTGFTSGTLDTSMPWSTSSRYLTMDVNGDGKTDMLELYPFLGTYQRKTWLSTGYSFTLVSNDGGIAANTGSDFVAADVNGDDRDDLVEFYPFGLVTARHIWLSTGSGFVSGPSDTQMGNNSSTKFLAMDVNGDGLMDMTELWPSFLVTARHVWPSAGWYPDLLTSLGNEYGGTMTVGYTASSAWANTNNPPIMQTATAVTISDGRGGSATTSYRYAGGLYDSIEQRFMGFRYEKETQPCIAGESPCPYTETWFRQDYGSMSKPERIDQRTGSGQLLTAKLYEYTTNGSTIPWKSLHTGTWEYTYINSGAACPGADCKRKYSSRTFNNYGEVTQEIDYGNYDVNGDEDTETKTYVPNPTAYIVKLPADVKMFQGVGTAGALLNETLTYYDGAASWNQAPSAGLPTKVAKWLSSPSSFVQTTKEYDSWGNVTAEVNALGARTTFVFDATYHLFKTSTTNALTQTTTSAWDVLCGEPTQTTDLNNQATTITYDALCRLATKNEPGGKFENHSWVNVGNAATQYEQIDRPAADGTAAPLWTRNYVDGLRRNWRTVTKGPDAATGDIYVDTAYNARGKEATRTAAYYWVSGAPQPTTYATTTSYDALDRVTRVTFADGVYHSKSYGLWSVTETDELGRTKTDRMNADGKRVAHDEIVGGATKTANYVYDARGNLAQSTDPASNVITYVTDSLGRKTSMNDPDHGPWTYEYDGHGRLTAQTDAKTQRTTFGYDALDRKTSKTANAGTGSAVTVSWTYDQVRAGYYNVGKLTTMGDPAGGKTFDHDAGGRVVLAVRSINGTSYTFHYGFDAGDRQLWMTYPDGDTQGTATSPLVYDSAGRLKSIPGYVASALYNADGKLIQINNANGTVTMRPHSAQRGWITGISTTLGGTTIQNLVYTRNNKGRITQVTSPFSDEGWTYAYDELDRLTSATNTSNASHNQTLAYDAIGNITSSSRIGTYTYGTRPHAVITAGDNTYAYDAAGLMTSGAGRALTWNGDNRVATITGGASLAFTYDADGARIQQVEGAITRRYLGDDYEVQVGGSTSKYISVAGTLVAREDGPTIYWVHTDHLGSIQAVTNASGVEVHRKKYRAFGEILSSSGTLGYEPRGYIGQRQDASNLLYLHARYYDPALGRFLSPDHIIDGTDTVGLNRYVYCGNDPINYSDVTGLKKDPVTRTKTAADRNKDFAEEEPTIGEPGKDKVRYTFYQKPIAKVGSHFKTIVTNDAGERVGVYSLNGVLKKYNNTDPSTEGMKPAGTIYKDASTLEAFNDAYMNVANGGIYDLGDSNAAVHKAIQAIGEPKGVFTLSNPVNAPVAAYGFDNAD